MHAPRLPFVAFGPFVARTDFTHAGVELKAGAPIVPSSVFDASTLWRAQLIDVAGPDSSSPVVAPPPKQHKRTGRAAPSGV